MSAVIQRLTENFGVEWLSEILPPRWTLEEREAFVFVDDRDADTTARQMERLLGCRALPVARESAPRLLFSRKREDWRAGVPNCGVE